MTQIIKELRPYRSLIEIFSRFKDEEDAVLLDSSLHNHLGRYSIMGRRPYIKLVQSDTLTVNGQSSPLTIDRYLKEYLDKNHRENNTDLPITQGAIGYFSYEYGRQTMGIRSRHRDETGIPLCILNFYDEFIIEDLAAKKVFLIANGNLQPPGRAIKNLEAAIKNITEPHSDKKEYIPKINANFNSKEYMDTLEKMLYYIVEGDIYIANMTQQISAESRRSPYEVFLKLRHINPSPFGSYLNYGDFKVISASPERFLRLKDNSVTTRPIKGTRKRGADLQKDEALKRELQNSGKDKSELLMIVDLERNDLNKVCVPGTVKVTELFTIEEYATVFHLVSTIKGQLAPEYNGADLIKATFPGGSITGAPKIRAMEIIDELEHDSRNLYTGSLGYIDLDGAMDLNIIIRTLLYKDGVYRIGAGGGITFESEPEFEYEEAWQKAKALLEALR
ncbi:MAG: aminodeoxychorismate synthase component I [Bacillota bacterium]|nr:aminodeoxychorismate synthase component I [Bacillota bacterium]